jgi:predicted RNA methylase
VTATTPGTASRARLYERTVPADFRAQRGLFYTPDEVADVMACGAIELWLSLHPGATFAGRTVVDPSCGAGALLAAAGRALGSVDARLVGRDIDAEAIAIARERLGARADVAQGDALADGPLGDIVLINPPYGRDPSCADRDRFVSFWRAALARVAPGGVLAVLAPSSWRTGVRYASARREVMGPSGIRRIIELHRGSFADAYVDTCIALCAPTDSSVPVRLESAHLDSPSPPTDRGFGGETLGALFFSRRGILAPALSDRGTPLLLGPVVPFVWPSRRSAFARVLAKDVVEGKAALALDRGPRLLIRRILGRASRLTCIVTSRPALVKKDFYILVPRDLEISLAAYSALLHSRPIAERLAASESASTKNDFAQVTLARLRALRCPRLPTPTRGALTRVRHAGDEDVDAKDPLAAAAWLELWARRGEALGRALSRERTRLVDADPRWMTLRARLDAFAGRMGLT